MTSFSARPDDAVVRDTGQTERGCAVADPPGSVLDLSVPPELGDLIDFPLLNMNTDPGSEGAPRDEMGEAHDEKADQLIRLRCTVRSLTGKETLRRMSGGGVMSDTGANSCLTNSEDNLVRCMDISPVTVGLAMTPGSTDAPTPFTCRRMGYMPMLQEDGVHHYQPFLIHPRASDTIMSPEAIMNSSSVFRRFAQMGVKGHTEGLLSFYDGSGDLRMSLPLVKRNGLYYSPIESVVPDDVPIRPQVSFFDMTDDVGGKKPVLRVRLPPIDESVEMRHPCDQDDVVMNAQVDAIPSDARAPRRTIIRRRPSTPAKQLEAELWAARLGFCGERQLLDLPDGVTGTPNQFEPHPFRFVDLKEQARIRKQRANRVADRVAARGQRFFVDFGFLRSSTEDYSQPNQDKDRVVESFDGFNCYLLIVDESS